ncbi:hypothetical protein D3C86_1982220 [compost metagenome]
MLRSMSVPISSVRSRPPRRSSTMATDESSAPDEQPALQIFSRSKRDRSPGRISRSSSSNFSGLRKNSDTLMVSPSTNSCKRSGSAFRRS